MERIFLQKGTGETKVSRRQTGCRLYQAFLETLYAAGGGGDDDYYSIKGIEMMGKNICDKYLLCMAVLVLPVISGCLSNETGYSPTFSAIFKDQSDLLNTYPCVSLSIFGSTPWHMYQEPCTAPYSLEIENIQVLRDPNECVYGSQYMRRKSYSYLVRHQSADPLFLSPGFNPLPEMPYGPVWKKYRDLRERESQYNADYPDLDKYSDQYQGQDGVVLISLIPLYSTDTAAGVKKIMVDHSMLVWLLDSREIWEGLHTFYEQRDGKEGVQLVAETICRMVAAHEEKWPGYLWTVEQKKVIEWYQTVSSQS